MIIRDKNIQGRQTFEYDFSTFSPNQTKVWNGCFLTACTQIQKFDDSKVRITSVKRVHCGL
jgi:hypothetical protein